jgi:hypothetical protein
MPTHFQRILAVEIRSGRFGFVLLEPPAALLDWGVAGYRANVSDALRRKICNVAEQFEPSLMISRQNTTSKRQKYHFWIARHIEVMQQVAQQYSIPVRFFDASAVRDHFRVQGRTNKYEVAQLIAAQFPELSWRMPAKRKPWQSEPASQALFDAAALAVLAFARRPDIPDE